MNNNLHLLLRSILILMCIIISPAVFSQIKVMTLNIDDNIDPRMNRYTKLAFEYADEIEAEIIIIEMDTYGGAVNDADDIRTRILEYPKPVWVFINKDAASAGALISIACDSIYMAEGSSIGAATVVTQDGAAAPDKYQSYMRSIMRSTAEAKGRNPQIAEAMVDQDIVVDSISTEGEVLTFSTSEAIKYGFCEGKESSIEDILKRNGITDYIIEKYELSGVEKIIRIFLNPLISGLLILVIIGGIYFELQTPGVGFPLFAALIAVTLYFVPYYLNGLAENWEIIIFFVGVALIALEIFVIPGFGIAGIAGLTLAIGSLILVMLNNDLFDFSFVGGGEIARAVATILIGVFSSVLILLFAGIKLTDSRIFKRIALETVQDSSEGYTVRFTKGDLLGKIGVAYTVLRPSGKIMIDGNLYDAYTRGDYINKNDKVEIIADSGTSLKVKRIV